MRDEEYIAIKDRAAEVFMRIPHVNAVGLGGREKNGQPTGEIVIKVFVDRKRPPEEVPPQELIPASFEGVPTDVVEMGPADLLRARPPTGIPRLGTPAELERNADKEKYRPLEGGIQLQVDRVGSGRGTLGCLMIDPGDPSKVYVLTNYHVVDSGSGSLTTDTRVGQPTRFDSCTGCCSDLIGRFAGGAKDTARDAALVRLDPGTKYKKEITEIGPVKGTYAVTLADAAPQSYQVRKRGRTSRLTGGVVITVHATHTSGGVTQTNALIIRPNPDPARPGTQMYFAQEGDSGSVVLNNDNEVVGLQYSGVLQPGASGLGNAAATPIDDVIAAFGSTEHIPVSVATAASSGVVHEVPGAARLAVEPILATSRRSFAEARAPITEIQSALPGTMHPEHSGDGFPGATEALEAALSRSPNGLWLRELWLRHQAELKTLVNENRRVATVWQRSGGAALFQALTRVFHDPEAVVPEHINNAPISSCLDRLHAVFSKYGSQPLRADMALVRPALPDVGGMSYSGIVAAIASLPPHRSGTRHGERRKHSEERFPEIHGTGTRRS